MSAPAKPVPTADPITKPFWDSAKAHALQIQRCNACGHAIFYPRGLCPNCFSGDLAWQPVSGRGVVHAFTIVYRHPNPAFQQDVPYVVAIIELVEGVRLMSNVVGVPADPEHLKVGMPVEVVYEDVSDDITLPKFQPVAE
jgi:uncharacterized OB-fold protein